MDAYVEANTAALRADVEALRADVAVLIEALLRQDADAAELRSRIDALEQTVLLRPYVTVNADVFRPLQPVPPVPPVPYKTTTTSHTRNTR